MTGIQELSRRENDGITVVALYDFDRNFAIVEVESEAASFALYPPDCKVLEAFHHPFAIADQYLKRGTFADMTDANA